MWAPLSLLCLITVTPSLASRLPHVIGGDDVSDVTRWPWQGSLESFWSHSCGCSLISTSWAVTAAHCLGTPIELLQVRFGSLIRESGGQVRRITKRIIHEDRGVGSGFSPNDIAVIQFDAVTLDDTVATIVLASTEQAGNPECFITGWGFTQEGDSADKELPEVLQEAKVNVYTKEFCIADWGSASINDGHVCIGDNINHRGSCSGDSGGPLVCKVGSDWELVGATSWSIKDCLTSRPAVYSRIAYFREWIQKNTRINTKLKQIPM